MSFITTKKSKSKDPGVDLPAGFDDADSDFYVHELLRPYWAEASTRGRPDIVTEVSEMSKAEAEAEALEQFGPVPDFDGLPSSAAEIQAVRASITDYVASKAPALLNEKYSHYAAVAEHAATREVAIRLYTAHEQAEEQRAEYVRSNTCPVCGACEPATTGYVFLRNLIPGGTTSNSDFRPFREDLQFTSCAVCYATASRIFIDAQAQAAVPNGATRQAAVEAALGQAFTNAAGETYRG